MSSPKSPDATRASDKLPNLHQTALNLESVATSLPSDDHANRTIAAQALLAANLLPLAADAPHHFSNWSRLVNDALLNFSHPASPHDVVNWSEAARVEFGTFLADLNAVSLAQIASAAHAYTTRLTQANEELARSTQTKIAELEGARLAFEAFIAKKGGELEAKIAAAVASTRASALNTMSKQYNRDFRKWVEYSVGAALGTLALLTVLTWLPSEHSWADVLARLTVLSIGGGITFACTRVAMASRHNEVLSRHRGSALRALPEILEAVGNDKDARTEVLKRSAAAIFEHQPTGFTKAEAQTSEMPAVIQQFLQPVKPGKPAGDE